MGERDALELQTVPGFIIPSTCLLVVPAALGGNISLEKPDKSGLFVRSLFSWGPATPTLARPSAGAHTLQLPVGWGRLPVLSSDTPPSPGWPGDGRRTPWEIWKVVGRSSRLLVLTWPILPLMNLGQ